VHQQQNFYRSNKTKKRLFSNVNKQNNVPRFFCEDMVSVQQKTFERKPFQRKHMSEEHDSESTKGTLSSCPPLFRLICFHCVFFAENFRYLAFRSIVTLP